MLPYIMVNHTTKLPVIFHHALMWFQHAIPLPTPPISVSYLLTSQKGTPLLVHPMLHPNIGSPRDPATLGDNNGYYRGYRLCLPCHPCFATTISVFYLVPTSTQHGGGGGSALFLPIRFLLVWPSTQIVIAGTVRSAPPPVRVWL